MATCELVAATSCLQVALHCYYMWCVGCLRQLLHFTYLWHCILLLPNLLLINTSLMQEQACHLLWEACRATYAGHYQSTSKPKLVYLRAGWDQEWYYSCCWAGAGISEKPFPRKQRCFTVKGITMAYLCRDLGSIASNLLAERAGHT